jgi:hypothetical protein
MQAIKGVDGSADSTRRVRCFCSEYTVSTATISKVDKV